MLALSALTLADTHVGLNPSRLWPGISDGGADESTLSSLFFAFAALGLQPPKFARC